MITLAHYKCKLRVCFLVFFLGIFVIPGFCQQTEPEIKIVNNVSGDPNILFSIIIQNLPQHLFYGEAVPEIAKYRINYAHWQTLPAANQRWQTGSGDNYDFVMDGQAYVEEADNIIEIKVKFESEELIVGDGSLLYALPFVKFKTNNQWVDNGTCVSTTKDTTLLFQVGPVYDPENIDNNKIKSVFYSVNGSQPIPLSTEITSILRELEIKFTANSSLHPGHNSIEIWAQGDFIEGSEYSDTVEVNLVILAFDQFPDNPTYIFSPRIPLRAIPAGGWFNGQGILGITPWFDPAEAGTGVHPIRYTIPIDGKNYSIEKTLEVSAVSTYNIDGDINVCSNSIHQYEITQDEINQDDPEADYSWIIEGAQESVIEGNKCQITWGESGSGRISAKINAPDQPPVEIAKLIYISCKQALYPPEIFWGDKNFQLLVCSEDNAIRYTWYKNEQVIETTFINYVFLNSVYQGTEDDLFYVEIESMDGCFTQSEPINCSKAFINETYLNDGSSLNILTAFDPYSRTITIEILKSINTPFTIEVLDSFGRKVIHKNLDANRTSHKIERIPASGLSAGIYIISISSNEQKIFRSKLFIN